ncbi:hypothetical protein AAGG49_22150, partial [Stenotrophomonas maltophilia]|uniref:hypothetical protein n=1 Tax=Stenotrophomonas maltophilia TaxID=40324 RepID=UPI00313ECAE6
LSPLSDCGCRRGVARGWRSGAPFWFAFCFLIYFFIFFFFFSFSVFFFLLGCFINSWIVKLFFLFWGLCWRGEC